MITVENFLNTEGNSYTKKLLLETIERLSSGSIEREELTFNIYSVVVFPKLNKVLISDDICPDENPTLIISLDKFYTEVESFEINEQ